MFSFRSLSIHVGVPPEEHPEFTKSARPYRFGQMCDLYSITTNQVAIAALVCVMESERRQPAAHAGRVSGLPSTHDPQGRCRPRDGDDALGNATAPMDRRPARHQHPQHVFPALAWLVETGKPMLGPR
jgi:hypothetical protein